MTEQPRYYGPPKLDNGEAVRTTKQWRKLRGMSIRSLAERAGMSTQTVTRIENGATELTGGTIQKLSEALGLDPEQIVEIRQALQLDPQPERPETP